MKIPIDPKLDEKALDKMVEADLDYWKEQKHKDNETDSE